jgi:hypothetical protein
MHPAKIRRRVLAVNWRQLRISAAAFVCLMLATLALAQSRRTLQDRYGSDVYRTSKGLVIKPTFAPNDALCAAQIMAEGRTMKEAELETVLEELAPKDARGKFIIDTFLDYTCLETDDAGKIAGAHGCGGVSEDYERVTITKWGNTNDYTAADVAYYRRGCKIKKPHHGR